MCARHHEARGTQRQCCLSLLQKDVKKQAAYKMLRRDKEAAEGREEKGRESCVPQRGLSPPKGGTLELKPSGQRDLEAVSGKRSGRRTFREEAREEAGKEAGRARVRREGQQSQARPGSRQSTRRSPAPASGAQSPGLSRVGRHGRSRAQGPASASASVLRPRQLVRLSRLYRCVQIQGPPSLSLSLFATSQLSPPNVFCVIVPKALPRSPDVPTAPAEKSCHAPCLSPPARVVFPRTRVREDPRAPCGCGL